MPITLLVAIIGVIVLLWLLTFVQQLTRSRLQETPTEVKPIVPVNLIDNKHGVIVTEGRGHLVYMNARAREWFGINGSEPNLALLASRTSPSELFHDLFADEGQASFRLGTKRVQGASHVIPGLEGRRIVVILKELTLPADEKEVFDPAPALMILQDISRTITEGMDLRQTLNSVLVTIGQVIQYDSAEINLWDRDLNTLRPLGRMGDRVYAEALENMGGVYEIDEGFTGWIARYEQPLILSDVSTRADVRPKMENFPFYSFIGVPLKVGERFIGTLELVSRQLDTFDHEDLALLEAVAGQAAIAIENARLSSGQASHLIHLTGLQQLVQAMDEVQNLPKLYETLTERIANLMNVQICGVLLYDEANEILISQKPFYGVQDDITSFYRIPAAVGGVAYDVLFNLPWWLSNDVINDERAGALNMRNLAEAIGLRSSALIPLALGSKRLGLLQIANKRDGVGLNEDDMRLVSIFAAQVAVVIENAKLQERERRYIAYLGSLHQVARINRASQNTQRELFAEVTQRVAELLQVETCGILFYEMTIFAGKDKKSKSKEERALVAQTPFHGIDDESIRFYQIPIVAGSVFDTLSKDLDAWVSNDIAKVDDWSGTFNFVQQASMVGLRKVLLVPLIVQGKRIGVLQIGNKRSGQDFTDSDVQLLTIAAGQTALLIENLRVSQEIQRSTTSTNGIRRLAEHIAQNLPLDDLIQGMLPEIADVLSADVVAVGVLSTQTSDLNYLPSNVYGAKIEVPLVFDVYNTDFDRSPVITRVPFRTTDATHDPEVLLAYRSVAQSLGVITMMQIPLVLNNRVLGEMLVANKSDVAFGPDEEQIGMTIGALVASIIERTRLPMISDLESRVRLEEQEAIDRITRELGETLLVDRVMMVIRSETMRTTPAADVSVVLFTPTETWNSADIPEIEQRLGGENFEVQTLAEVEMAAFHLRQKIYVEDYTDNSYIPVPTKARSAYIQPIYFGEEVVGLIHLYSEQVRAFDDDVIGFVERLGQQASLAVSNARRYNMQVRINERLRRRASQVEQIFGLSQLMREGANLSELMQEVAYAVSETVGFGIVLINTRVKSGQGFVPVAQAGLPLNEFRETSLIVRPIDQVKFLMDERWKVSNSYFLPAEKKEDWKKPEIKFVRVTGGQAEKAAPASARMWNAEDLLLVPMLDSRREIIGYISVDNPLDGRRPNTDTLESLEVFASQASFIIENLSLVDSVKEEAEATRRERDRLAQLHLISREIQLKGDLDERLQVIADGIAAAGWQRVQLTLRDEKLEPTMLIHSGYSDEESQRIRVKMLPGSVWRQRFNDLEFHELRLGNAYYLRYDSPWVLKNFFKGGRRPDPPRVSEDTWHPQDSLYLPLMGQDQKRIIGLLRMELPIDGRRPTEASLQPIELFALQAAAAIENTRLYEETVRQAQTEQRLNELMEAMASTLDRQEIIQALAIGLRPVVDLARLHLALPSDDASVLDLTRVEYTADGKVHIFSDNPLSRTNTAFDKVLEAGKSEIFNLTIEYQFKDYEDLKQWVNEGEKATLLVPMTAGGATIGILRLGTALESEQAFGDAQNITLIQRMANLSAVSIQNSRLFGSLERTTAFNQGIVEAIQQGIIVLDAEMVIRTVNTFMIKRYHWSLDSIGRTLFAYRPDFKDYLEDSIQSALNSGHDQRLFDVQDIDADGKLLIRNFYVYPLRQGERVTGVVLLVEDITERALLSVELENRAEQLAALTQVSNQMTETLQPDQVGEVVLDALGTVIPYDAVVLWLLDADNEGRLVIKAARGFQDQGSTPEDLIGLWVEIESSQLFKEMASRQRVINVVDTTTDTERFPYGGQRVYRNWLGAPLISKGQVIGVLQLEKKEVSFYNANHEQLVSAFANQAAVALNNAQLFAETQDRAEELNRQADRLALLNRVSVALAHSLDQENIFEITLLRMAEALNVEEAAAIKIDTEDGIGRVVIEHPRGDEEPAITFRLTGNDTLHTLMSKISPTVIENFPNSTYAKDVAPIMRRSDVYSTLFVPLVLSGTVVGVMRLDGIHPTDRFTTEQINLAQTIASQAAIAVQNASLYEQSVRRTYELQTLFDASQSIAVTLDAADVNRRVATLILLALQADTAAVMMWDSLEGYLELAETTAAWDEIPVDPKGSIYKLSEYPKREQALVSQKVEVLRLDDTVLDNAEKVSMEKRGVFNRLFAPLVVNEVSIGLVQVEMRDKIRYFESDQLRLVRTLTTQTAIAIENARLQTETRTQLEELYLINDISKAVSSMMTFEGLLEQLHEQLPMLTDAQYIYLSLFDPIQNTVRFPIAIDQSGKSIDMEEYQLNVNDEFGYLIQRKLPLLLTGDDIAARRQEAGIIESKFAESKSFFGVPMLIGDEVVGALALRDDVEARKFSLSDQRVLTTISSQLAIAFQNARLFQQTRAFAQELEQRVSERTQELVQERQRISTLYEIASEIAASTLDLERVLTRTLDAVAAAIGASMGVVLKVDDISDRLYVLAQIGLEVDHEDERLQLSLNEGLAGWIIQNRQGVVIGDVQNDYRWVSISERERKPRSAVAALLESGEEVSGVIMFYDEHPNVFTDDHQRLVAAAASQLANAMNSAELYGLIRDQAERLGAILRQEQVDSTKNNAILNSIADGVMYANEKGIIRQFNEMAERILGLSDDQVLNRHINELAGIYGGRAASWTSAIQKWMADPTQIQSGEFQEEILTLEDGQVISVRLSPVNMGDQFLGTVSVFRDISREAEVDRLKSKFVENVSHELRTPMTSIKGYADLLLLGAAGQISEAQQRFLMTIKQNADRLTILVNDLLEVSRIDQKRKLHFTAVDVTEVLSLVSSYLAGRIKEAGKNLQVITEISPDLPHIRADYDKIIQVIQNLADNAFNYTEAGGKVTLGAQYVPDDNAVVMTIKDTGIGIPDEVKSRIFERFYRGDEYSQTVFDTPGTGLGLAIVKDLVELHQGEITFTSEIGKGSTFFVKIRVAGYVAEEEKSGQDDL